MAVALLHNVRTEHVAVIAKICLFSSTFRPTLAKLITKRACHRYYLGRCSNELYVIRKCRFFWQVRRTLYVLHLFEKYLPNS